MRQRSGERFGDADLFALALHEQGYMLVKGGRVKEGLGLLDEAMVAVTAGELSPIVTGMVYCSVILACQEVYELRRAQEWTAALTRWCERQRDLVAFTGRCLIHRAEILQLRGAWPDALEEARRPAQRPGEPGRNRGRPHYRQAELHRLPGEFDAAEEAYREASRHGWEPQPGLAQLRLAQGRSDAAAAAIRRVLDETAEPLRRAGCCRRSSRSCLPTASSTRRAAPARELEEIAGALRERQCSVRWRRTRGGAVELAEGDARAALVALRRAWQAWQELEAPYEAARVRVLIALACRSLGDEDTATLELEGARRVFERARAQRPTSPASTRSPAAGALATRTG